MSNPVINLTVIDPGALSRPVNTDQIPIYVGVSESGDDFVVREFAREEDLLAYGGAGHLIDVAQSALQTAESVKIMKIPRSTAGTFEALSTDDPLIASSFTGTPLQFLRGQLVITKSALISTGTAKAKLSLDAWDIAFIDPSFNDEFLIPASGIVTLPGTGGLAVHLLAAQTPAVGDSLDFETTPGHYSAAAIALCLDPLLSPAAGVFTYLVFTGDAQTASAANTLAQAVIALKTSFYTRGQFYPMLVGAGLDTDIAITAAFANTTSDPPFVSVGGATFAYWTSPRATPARGRFALREHEAAAIRIAGIAISTDPGRTADGPIVQIVGLDYDAAVKGSLLHDARIGTLRSWHPQSQGYFVNRQRMLAKSDSNFESWQFAAIMAEGLRAAQRALFRFMLDSLRRTVTSTLDPRDASDVKTSCENEIDAALMIPENARGIQGHISARKVIVSLTTVLPALSIRVQLRPLGYPTDISGTLEYGNAD